MVFTMTDPKFRRTGQAIRTYSRFLVASASSRGCSERKGSEREVLAPPPPPYATTVPVYIDLAFYTVATPTECE